MAGQPVELGKARLGGRVVQIDREVVGEVELEPAQRALFRRLLQPLGAVAIVDDAETGPLQITGIGLFLGPQLLVGDRAGHVPGRVQHDAADRRDQHRRLVARAARDGLHRHHRIVAVEHGQHGRGDVHLDTLGLQLLRQPAPAFHVRHDLADALRHRHVQHGDGLAADGADRVQAIATLRAPHRRQQILVEPVARGADRRVFHRQPLAQRQHLRSACAKVDGGRRERRPAPRRRHGTIAGEPLHQRVIARIGRRQRGDPGRQPIAPHRLRKAGRGVVRLRTNSPVLGEVGRIQPPDMHRMGIIQRDSGQCSG